MSLLPEVLWTVRLARSSFEAVCPRCAVRRGFSFSGRARVNAHRKMLDAWLLYLCSHCERTAKVPVFERTPVRAVDPALLEGLHRNDPVLLGSLCAKHVGGVAFAVEGPRVEVGTLVLHVEPGVRVRLDRVLALGLGLTRKQVRVRFGQARLSRRVHTGLRVQLV